MRLLYLHNHNSSDGRNHRSDIGITKDLIDNDIPAYAMLSHTWGADDEELTFKDLVECSAWSKAGYQKLRFCAEQADRDGLAYFWTDTCCIDKSNNTKFSEAINSMFLW